MSELQDLYQRVILEHDRAPRNYGQLSAMSHTAEAYNPLCGDRLRVGMRIAGQRVEAIAFEGDACTIARASGSLMTLSVLGREIVALEALVQRFETMLRTGEPDAELADLAALGGVRRFPSRIRCATLAWHAALSALREHSP